MAEQRRSQSMLPNSPSVEADFRTATDAMQRAAEAMIAATESFRRQFAGEDDISPRRLTFNTYGSLERSSMAPDSPSDGRPASVQLPPSMTGSTAIASAPVVSASSSRPGSRSSSFPINKPSPVATPAAALTLADYLPRLPDVARLSSETGPSFGVKVVAAGHSLPRSSSDVINRVTPTPDWPSISNSTPNLAETVASPAVKTGPGSIRRQGPAHVDLLEAASRTRPAAHQGFVQGRASGEKEPASVIQIGRHTYIRSEADDGQVSLIRDEASKGSGDGGGATARPHGFSLTREVLFVLVISLAQMLMLAGIAQALVPAQIIGQSFPDTNPGHIAWYSAAYGLTSGTFVLPSGRLGDLFGHKKIFIIGFLWFALWSLIAGFAEMVQQAGGGGTVFFIFSRAMQGIGPALLVPNGQALLGRAYPPGPRKNIVMCLFSAAAPFGFVVGGVMASLFAIKASWPWAFFTMAAMCLALAAVSASVLPPTEQTRRKAQESLWAQLDGAGMLLGVSGLILFNFAFNQAPIVSWTTPYTYFLLVIGVLLLAAFVYTELGAAHPLVPITAMRSTANFVLGCTAAGWGCFAIWIFYTFSFLEVLRGWSPLLSSAAMAHGPLSGLAASLLTGYLMGRVKPHWIMLASMAAFFAGSLLMTTAPVGQSYWLNTFFSVLIMPFGMDMSNPAATILLSNSVGKEHQGIAASLVVTTVNYSISIALGFAGTIEMHVNSGGADLLAGYRGAQYFGLGLGFLGIALAAAFLAQSYARRPPPAMPEGSKEET